MEATKIIINGEDIELVGTEYSAGAGIKIGNSKQGPAPTGFHIPSRTELSTLRKILIETFGLPDEDTTTGTYLKMPMAGYRSRSAAISGVGNTGRYWSSSAAYLLSINSNYIEIEGENKAYAFSIRAFKDEPVKPESSWTTLYNGSSVATGAGIFYDGTNGLISFSGDGKNWYTIQDKNLGATTVYNQGDALTDANCGYFFQRGNNYGFPHSGNVTTSNTQVDASGYGIGGYSSDVYIIGNYDWSSVQNDNLRGGQTSNDIIINAGVLSVNGQTGDVTVTGGVTSVNGDTGAVTLKTINNTAINGSGNISVQASLSNITAADIKTGTATTQRSVTAAALAGAMPRLSTQANNILSSGMKIRVGTQANYDALGTYSDDTVYITI